MMKKTTKLMPLKRHKRSQNTGVVYTLADEATVVESPMRFPPIRFRCAAATAASIVAVHFRAVGKFTPAELEFPVLRCEMLSVGCRLGVRWRNSGRADDQW